MYLDEFDFAKKLIVKVGIFLKDQTIKEVESSKDKDIKLELDKISEKMIVDELKKYNYAILSEEMGLKEGLVDELIWIIDPIDGTLNYSRNNPSSCISIAFYKGSSPVFGLIYDFNRDELFSGHVELGVFLNEESFTKKEDISISNAILATGFPTYLAHDTKSLSDFIKQVQKYKKIRMIGSAALSLAYVATDRFDTYVEKSIKLWDVAAGIAINQSLGKKIEFEIKDNYLMDVKVGVF